MRVRGVLVRARHLRWADSDELTARWLARSLATVWPDPQVSWRGPAVDAMAEALVRGGDLRPVGYQLGQERSQVGLDLTETRGDVRVAAEVAGLDRLATVELLDASTLGWTECSLDRLFAEPCLDPVTELAPVSYMSMRISELQAKARAANGVPTGAHALLVVRMQPVPDPLIRETRMIAVHTSFQVAFLGGDICARVGPNTAAAILDRRPSVLNDALARLRREFVSARFEGRLDATRMWLEKIPVDAAATGVLLRELSR